MMEADTLAKKIQEFGDNFINDHKNWKSIMDQFEKNKVIIHTPFDKVKISNIEPKSWGVYVFYITPGQDIDYDTFKKFWEKDLEGKPIKYIPKVIKKRFKELKKDIPTEFYVGKSQNLSQRIKEHIHLKTNESTYSLKLSRHGNFNNSVFGYSYYVLKENPDENIKDGMNFLLEKLEKKLRKKFEPLIGKQ